jgi:hypothetical protein
MEFLTSEMLYQLAILGIGLIVANFISIHSMANILLYDGSSRQKSLRISAEFSLLSTVFVYIAILIRNIITSEMNVAGWILLGVFLASYALFVELFRIWYVRREYETTVLYAFLIAEGLMIFLQMGFAVLEQTILLWL